MNALWYNLLVFWHRLLGRTKTQAEWRAREALGKPAQAKRAVGGHVARTADRRFTCVCGQLLVAGDRVCPRCNRRQYLPFGVRRAMRTLGLAVPNVAPGTTLVGLLMAVGYVAQVRYGGGGLFNPGSSLDSLDLGAAIGPLTLGPQPWRAFTYTMLHGGLMHIAFNGFALMQIGPLVENRFGTARFLFAWVVAGAAGVVVPPLLGLEARVPVIGASGAVFGLIGMAMLRGHLDGDARGRMIRDVMIRWTIYTTLFGLFLHVAHGAHFGGLAAGALVALVLPPPDGHPARKRLSPVLATAALAVMLLAIAGAVRWRQSGGVPPDTRDPEFDAAYTLSLVQARGVEPVLGAEAAQLLLDFDAALRRPIDPSEPAALKARIAETKARLGPPKARVLDELLAERWNAANPGHGRP